MKTETVGFRGIPCVRLRNEGATALVALHGAQVLSWIPADGRERLFLGERAKFAEGSAIRGGVPVIFPQFGERGALVKHGFARTLAWRCVDAQGEAAFELRNDAYTAQWPHAFTAALHTYLHVDDLAGAALEGLQGCDYEDSAAGGVLRREDGWEVRFESEVDRIYNDVVAPLLLRDGMRELAIEQDGFPDVVVWNPGEHLAARIGDLAPGEYRQFVCVEAGAVLQPEVLAPGESWEGTQTLG
ncbi:MAG: D-hexose-6-phosphate mutarotase [Pseudoxanthomonas sp.]